MSDDVPQELETIDPYNPPEGYDGPRPLETIDPYNPAEGYDGPRPLETIDPYNPPEGYEGCRATPRRCPRTTARCVSRGRICQSTSSSTDFSHLPTGVVVRASAPVE